MTRRLFPTVATAFLMTAAWAVSSSACEGSKSAQAAAAKEKASCSAAHATGTAAVTASADGKASGCAAHGTYSSKTAAAESKKVDAYAAGGSSCSGRGVVRTTDAYSHLGCDACADMALCRSELSAVGSKSQVIKLKNGVMIVYTAQGAGKVNAVQAAMTRHSDRWNALTAAIDKAKLCPDCETMRNAVAAGKLHQEMVTIEGGCLNVTTSTDPAMVAKLHSMVSDSKTAVHSD